MREKKYNTALIVVAICCLVLFACSKMDDTYDDFIKDGEIVYTAKVDSIKAYPGNNRMSLSMLLISDPRISKVQVFWEAGGHADSTEKTVQRTAGVDTVRFSFPKLAEGTYTFYIYTYDNAGHQSVKSDVIGTVYGEKYINQLVNRAIKSGTYDGATNTATVKWYGVGTDVIGEEIIYTDMQGAVRKQIEKHEGLADSLTVLPAFTKGSSFQFRTYYKPAPNALDTFYSGYESRLVP